MDDKDVKPVALVVDQFTANSKPKILSKNI